MYKRQITEELAAITAQMSSVQEEWKSARGWEKIQPRMREQFTALQTLVDAEQATLGEMAGLVNRASSYVDELNPTNANEFKQSKALLEEAYDVIVSGANALASGKSIDSYANLMEQLSADQVGDASAAAKRDPLAGASKVEASIFVPGGSEISAEEKQDLDRREKAARDRAAALRIRTETLDSLTNDVGDASMNRSQMREDVLTIKSVVEELYSNVQRFGPVSYTHLRAHETS